MPEKIVIVHLGNIIENTRILAVGTFNNGFHVLTFKFRTGKQLVPVVNIGLMVFAVMVFKCFRTHGFAKGIGRKGKLWQGKSHKNAILD